MANTRILPDVSTWEGCERYAHRDIPDLDPMPMWAECHQIETKIATLVYRGDPGPLITVVDGMPIYALSWLHERLARLQAALRRKAA